MTMRETIVDGSPRSAARFRRGILGWLDAQRLFVGAVLAMVAVIPRLLPAETPAAPQPVAIGPMAGGAAERPPAVDRALAWLIEHQLDDGSWSFDLDDCPKCQGKCSHSGEVADRPAATSLAILPFLGRGYTHRDGPYKRQIERGIALLAARAVLKDGMVYDPLDRQALYVQGLASLALSECYGMTADDRLRRPAQLAIDHVMAVQDQRAGGWGYRPGDVGHTVAAGLQVMALKSGALAGLDVDPQAFEKAGRFLDSVQVRAGAEYGNAAAMPPESAPSAAGLLCRMFLGWKRDDPALQGGIVRLANVGPGRDLLFDYYATQLMHHMEGDVWMAWNGTMKPLLLRAQATEGHEAGSWHEGVAGGDPLFVGAGRLQSTALATMILEVYYRHMPIYRDASCPAKAEEE